MKKLKQCMEHFERALEKNGGYHRKKRSRESREDAVLMDRESNMTYSLISVTHLDWLL